MARPELTTTLNQLRSVVKAMRELGVASWAGSPMGDLILGTEPSPRDAAPKEVDENAERRRYYVDVLNRPVTDEELKKLP